MLGEVSADPTEYSRRKLRKFLTLSAHAPEGYSNHLVCRSVNRISAVALSEVF